VWRPVHALNECNVPLLSVKATACIACDSVALVLHLGSHPLVLILLVSTPGMSHPALFGLRHFATHPLAGSRIAPSSGVMGKLVCCWKPWNTDRFSRPGTCRKSVWMRPASR